MARLRLLLALGLMAIGTMFGALALSGYYNPHAPHGQPMVASITTGEGASLLRPQPRRRFVAAETTPVVATPPKAKPVAKPPPREAKPKAKDNDKRPQQAAAAQWPWNLFGN
jgi:hypothetical protein